MGKVIAVTNWKGGTGKTTTAVTLAHGLARMLEADEKSGYVLLVDLDPQGNVALSLGIKPNDHDIAKLLVGRQTARDAIMSADRSEDGGPSRPNLLLIPASPLLHQAEERLLAEDRIREFNASRYKDLSGDIKSGIDSVLVEKLGAVAERCAFTIIDCPPTIGILEGAVYNFADDLIVPIQPEYLATAGSQQLSDSIVTAIENGFDINIRMVVPTMYDNRRILDRRMVEALKAYYGESKVADPIPKSVAVAEAPASGGLTIFEYAPTSKPALAYQKFTETIYYG